MVLAAPDPNSKFNQGEYVPLNPEKYKGSKYPVYRSSWELDCCKFFDNNKNILEWSSESISIPYKHPFKKRMARYFPDFSIKYMNKSGQIKAELIEVKPMAQTLEEAAKTKRDREQIIINHAKWEAATRWARSRNILFSVWTEEHIYKKEIKRLKGAVARPRKTTKQKPRVDLTKKSLERKTDASPPRKTVKNQPRKTLKGVISAKKSRMSRKTKTKKNIKNIKSK